MEPPRLINILHKKCNLSLFIGLIESSGFRLMTLPFIFIIMAYLGKTQYPSYFFLTDETTMALAKRLRCNMTSCEKILWKQLKAKNVAGAKFRRQHPVRFYIADFYCHEARLVIEVDGPIHKKSDNREHDANRDAEMDRLGIKVMRFTNDEIKNHIGMVIRSVKESVLRARLEGHNY